MAGDGPDCSAGALNHAVIALARAHRNAAAALLGRHGLHPGQEVLLMLLWRRDGQGPRELASRLGVEPPTVTKMLGRLEQAGLVVREPSPCDRRAVVVRLTAPGRGLRADVERVWRELEDTTVAGFTGAERADLLGLLQRAARNLAR